MPVIGQFGFYWVYNINSWSAEPQVVAVSCSVAGVKRVSCGCSQPYIYKLQLVGGYIEVYQEISAFTVTNYNRPLGKLLPNEIICTTNQHWLHYNWELPCK